MGNASSTNPTSCTRQTGNKHEEWFIDYLHRQQKENMTINWATIETYLSPSKIYDEENDKLRVLSWIMRIVSRSQIQENNDRKKYIVRKQKQIKNMCSKKRYFRHKIREELVQYWHVLYQSSIIPIIGLTSNEAFVAANELKNIATYQLWAFGCFKETTILVINKHSDLR